MKKLTHTYRAWLRARQRNESGRRFRGASRPLVKVFGPSGAVVECRSPGRVTPLPSNFCLEQNRDNVVAFLDSLRSRFVIRTKQRQIPRRAGKIRSISPYFDFSTIMRITPAAALVLAAEYDRARIRKMSDYFARVHNLKQMHPDVFRLTLIDVDKWEPSVVRTLQQLGFFALLDIDYPQLDPAPAPDHILSFRSGTKVDPEEAGKLTEELKDLLLSLRMPDSDATVHLQGRLIDAIQNVRDHAYPQGEPLRFPHVGRWWMTASVDKEENRLDVVVYDQGITIPGSIPMSPRRNDIAGYLKNFLNLEDDFTKPIYDGKNIKAAIEIGQSKTQQSHRGRGLMFMRELVNFCRRGELRILSRNGGYLYSSDGTELDWIHDTSIGGTLVEWKLYL